MHLIKERLDIEESLEKRIKNTLKFLNIKSKIIKGNIINIPKTNIAYIEPHKLIINDITYLFFMNVMMFILIIWNNQYLLMNLKHILKQIRLNLLTFK